MNNLMLSKEVSKSSMAQLLNLTLQLFNNPTKANKEKYSHFATDILLPGFYSNLENLGDIIGSTFKNIRSFSKSISSTPNPAKMGLFAKSENESPDLGTTKVKGVKY